MSHIPALLHCRQQKLVNVRLGHTTYVLLMQMLNKLLQAGRCGFIFVCDQAQGL